MDLTGIPKSFPDRTATKIVPSVVSLAPTGELVVGDAARELLLTHPERTVYSVKRLMGRGVADVQEELKLFPFRIAEGSESVIRLAARRPTCSRRRRSRRGVLRQLKAERREHAWASKSRRP